MTLAPEDVSAIAAQVVAQLGEIRRPAAVLTLREAIPYVGKNSPQGFQRWCAKMAVTNCGQGRYSRAVLDRGLERESRGQGRKS